MKRTVLVVFLAIGVGFLLGCSRTQVDRDFNGLKNL